MALLYTPDTSLRLKNEGQRALRLRSGQAPALLGMLLLALYVGVECVVDGELARQALFVGDAHGGEAVCDRAQADAFGRDILLAFDIGSADDQAQALQG